MNNLERGVAEAATMEQVNTAIEEALDNLPARGGGGLILADFHEMGNMIYPKELVITALSHFIDCVNAAVVVQKGSDCLVDEIGEWRQLCLWAGFFRKSEHRIYASVQVLFWNIYRSDLQFLLCQGQESSEREGRGCLEIRCWLTG